MENLDIDLIEKAWRTGNHEDLHGFDDFPDTFRSTDSVYSMIGANPTEKNALSDFFSWIQFLRSLYFQFEASHNFKIPRKSSMIDFATIELIEKDQNLLLLKKNYLEGEDIGNVNSIDLAIFPLQRLRAVKMFLFLLRY